MRRLRKIIKYLLISVVLLVVIVVAGGYYFLGTNSGLKQVIDLANRYSGYQVSADSIDGDLLSRSELKGLRVSGNNLDFVTETVVLDWQSKALWDKSLIVKAISIDGASVAITPTAEEKPQVPATAFNLSDIDLPINIQLQDLLITNLTIKNPAASDIVIDKIQLGVDYIGQKAVIHTLQIHAFDTQANLLGEVETQGDFPLHLQSNGDYDSSTYGQQQVTVSVDGALKQRLNLGINGKGTADFTLNGALSALFSTPALDAKLSIAQFDGDKLGMAETALHGDLALAGSLGQTPTLDVDGEIFYDSPDTDQIKLTLDGSFDGDRADLSAFTVDLLTAKQQLTGQGGFSLTDKNIDIAFTSQALHWPQSAAQPAVTLKNTVAQITGTLDDYQLHVQTRGDTTAVGAVDLNLNGRGSTSALTQFTAKATLNGEPLTLSGNASWQPALQYTAQVKADNISPFNQLPGIQRLNLRAHGDADSYTAEGGVYVYADNIPPADITLAVSGSPTQLDKADITLKTLGGEIAVNANGGLSPLDVVAKVVSQHIQPQQFYPDIEGNINHTLHLSAKQNGENLTAEAIIEALSGQLQGYPLSGNGTVRFEQADNRVTVEQLAMDLAGNRLHADGALVLDGKHGESDLQANIDAKHLDRLLPDLSGELTAAVVAKGTLSAPELTAEIHAADLVYQAQSIDSVEATANVHVSAAKVIHADSVVFVDSPSSDKIQLTLKGSFDGDRADLSALTVDLLTAKQQLTGKGSYMLSNQKIDVKLNSDALYWPQSAAEPGVALNQTSATLTGALDNYRLTLSTRAETPTTGIVPLTLTADGDTASLQQFAAEVKLNEQPLTLDGNAAWSPKLAYQVRLRADEIAPQQAIPGFKKLDINVAGDDKQYRVNGGLYVYADNIPPADIQLAVDGTPQRLKRADIDAKTLGGKVQIRAEGALSPLNLTAKVNSQNIQPQQFYPGLEANISEQLTLTATQDGENLTAVAVLEKLSGKLQQYPLSGKGEVRFEQADNRLNIKGLSLNLAGNSLKADGSVALDTAQNTSSGSGESSKLTARLDAPQLKRLLPDLGGALNADIVLTGNLAQPAVKAEISGSNLAYQDHRAQTLKTTANVNLGKESLALNADIQGIQSGDNRIDRASVKIDGKFADHQLRLDIATPKDATIPALQLAGKGGLDSDNMAWNGKLNTLNLDSALLGQWGLAKTTALTLSSEVVRIQQLCLQHSPSSLCADGEMRGGKGDFEVVLSDLATRQFKALMPDSIDVDTSLSSKTTIQLRNGKPNVSSKLSANGGKLTVNAGGGVLASEIQQLDAAVILKNNRLQSAIQSRWSKLGNIDIAAEVPNLSQGKVKANIKIDTPSLQFIEGLVPQLSDVSGSLDGDMTVSGNPAKALQVAGKITLHKTDFNVPQFGSEIRGLNLDIFAKNGNQIGFKGNANAGGGNFNVEGEVNPATRRGNIHLQGENFQVADSNKLQIAISPDIQVVLDKHIKVRGEVLVPKALIVPESTGSKVTVSDDVVLPGQQAEEKSAAGSPVDVEIAVKLGDDVRVASADIETRLLGGIKINAKPDKAPKATGSIEVETGELRIYGQMLNIERGRVIFSNGPIDNPSLDIRTTRDIDDDEVTVGANILGTVQKPEISLFSTPSMADSSILSYLLFGRAPDSDSFGTAALLQTGGMVGANTLARDMRSSLGLDVLDFSLTGMEAGKNLSKALYVGMQSNFLSAINKFLLNYKISGRTHLESSVSADEISLDLIKVIETD